MRREDEHIPLGMGLIGQETCGAGGMAYGLRSCVDMIEAVHDIRQYAPDAWILNYSNPAAIVAEALRREFPDDKRILNICDQPENVVRSCSRLLGCDWEDLDPVYFGLNHYGWFTHMYDAKHRRGPAPEDPGDDQGERLPASGRGAERPVLAGYLRHGADHHV